MEDCVCCSTISGENAISGDMADQCVVASVLSEIMREGGRELDVGDNGGDVWLLITGRMVVLLVIKREREKIKHRMGISELGY